jgi:hypothetical protein
MAIAIKVGCLLPSKRRPELTPVQFACADKVNQMLLSVSIVKAALVPSEGATKSLRCQATRIEIVDAQTLIRSNQKLSREYSVHDIVRTFISRVSQAPCVDIFRVLVSLSDEILGA